MIVTLVGKSILFKTIAARRVNLRQRFLLIRCVLFRAFRFPDQRPFALLPGQAREQFRLVWFGLW